MLAFEYFSFLSSGGNLFYQSETIFASLVGNYLGNIPVNFESHWLKSLGGDNI